ncbi:hypothetical protein AU512_05370 [Lonsdalea iberica]|uniref:YdgH/BhsA/McbA-like domain-containing protein n=1 Tax=Lonsdalea iberica TaxID=1082703 RepID=A0ABX3XIG2_9GAMM|nr:DUF1471 family protein YdgH [Lonsdalea iberica]OSN10951.1 hypothetical protein AU512_05370 [Lonsdalea iberica]
MKLRTRVIASTLLSILAFSAQSAQELTPEKAAAVKPFERITFMGRYNAIYEAAADASKRADEKGADAFYIQSTAEVNGGRWAVTVDLYHNDAPKVSDVTTYREFSGVKELPKNEASQLEPFDTVTVSGYFPTQLDVAASIGEAARRKAAYSFFIVRQVDINSRGNSQNITAFIYKKEAAKRRVQSPDVIPADSQAGKAALAAGGETAKRVEIPGVATSSSLSGNVGNFFQTQSSTVGPRYTVTTRDGNRIQELNNATAAQMVPFDSVSIRGRFSTPTEMTEAIAKRAADKGAKYYHITKEWQDNADRYTISADLYK